MLKYTIFLILVLEVHFEEKNFNFRCIKLAGSSFANYLINIKPKYNILGTYNSKRNLKNSYFMKIEIN